MNRKPIKPIYFEKETQKVSRKVHLGEAIALHNCMRTGEDRAAPQVRHLTTLPSGTRFNFFGNYGWFRFVFFFGFKDI